MGSRGGRMDPLRKNVGGRSFRSESTLGLKRRVSDFKSWWMFMARSARDVVVTLEKKGQEKVVDADEAVLATYHESYLYGIVAPSFRFRAALRSGAIGTLLALMELFIVIGSVMLYVQSTYKPCSSLTCIRMDRFLSAGFVAAFIIKLYSAPVRILYIFSFAGIVDLIGTIPIFFFDRYKSEDTPAIDILVFLRVLSLFPLSRRLGLLGNTVKRRILVLVGNVLGMVFVFAGIFQWIERQKVFSEDCSQSECADFYKSFYFMIVTVSTVGYGDVTPKTSLGRLVMIVTIAAALTLVPSEIAQIADLAARRPYGGSYIPRKTTGTRYVILTGSLPYQTMRNFLAEFYYPVLNADLAAFPLKVVVMAPLKPSFQVKTLISSYEGHVRFMEGSPLEESDLERVSAKRASAFYLLADKNTEDFAAEDSAQMARALSVSNFCGPDVRVLVELLNPESLDSPFWTDNSSIELLCPEELRLKLLARSCHVRGISTLICNLFVSALSYGIPEKGSWLHEYYSGLEKEIYPVLLPKIFTGMEFTQVAETIYKQFEALLIGLDVEEEAGKGRKLLLNPRGRALREKDVGLVIADSLVVVTQISIFEGDGQQSLSKCRCQRKLRSSSCYYCKGAKSAEEELARQQVETKSQKRGTLIDRPCENWQLKAPQVIASSSHRSMLPHLAPKRCYESGGSCMGKRRSIDSPHEYLMKKATERFLHITSPPQSNTITKSDDPEGAPAAADAASVVHPVHQSMDGPDACMLEREKDFEQSPPLHEMEVANSMVEVMLQWPPVWIPGKPRSSVLEFNREKIATNLQERTRSYIHIDEPHIVVCCEARWPRNLYYFIEQFRIPALPNPTIVILSPKRPSTEEWGCIGLFKDVFYIKGSGTFEVDLRRAGIHRAEHVVVFGEDFSLNGGLRGTDGEQLTKPNMHALELTNSLIVTNVERWAGGIGNKVTGEIMCNQAFRYLKPIYQIDAQTETEMTKVKMRDANFLFLPCYAEGKGFPSSMISFVMSSSFTIRNAANLILQILEGGKIAGRTDAIELLDMIPVPESLDNITYGEAFSTLIHEAGMLPLGLYRAAGTGGSPTQYVYTSPESHTIVHKDDFFYVFREVANESGSAEHFV